MANDKLNKAAEGFARYCGACPHRIQPALERRPGNALNLEIGAPAARCTMRKPKHWGEVGALRWLGSGGSPLVFGVCSASGCPLKPDHCDDCGRRASTHMRVNGRVWPFDCSSEQMAERLGVPAVLP